MVGTVTYATVQESEKRAAIAVTLTDGTSRILMQPMTDAEFSDYKAHPRCVFQEDSPGSEKGRESIRPFRFFCRSEQRIVSRDALAAPRKPSDFDPNGAVSDADLLAEYCEALVAAAPGQAKKPA
jgi:hypothetical protein